MTDTVVETETELLVSTNFELDADLSTFNATETRQQLALMYSVPPEYIVLNATAGSVVVDVTIVLPASAAATRPLAQVQQQVASTNSSTLAISLGAAVMYLAPPSVSNRSFQVNRQYTRLVQILCFPGHWCQGGGIVPCERGFYNLFPNQYSATACVECQAYSTTNAIGTIEPRDCICKRTFLRIDPPLASMNDTRAECKCDVGFELKYSDETGQALCRRLSLIHI